MPSRKLGIDCRSSCICVYQVIEEPANYKLLSEEPSRTLQEVEGDTYFDGVSLEKIANEIGTPTYLYSAKSLMKQYRELEAAFRRVDSKIFYSVKANSNVNIISLLKQLNSVTTIARVHSRLMPTSVPKCNRKSLQISRLGV